jgi:2'-5' RNA ligase
MRPDRLHISLKGMGTCAEPAAHDARRALGAMSAVRRPPFRVAFNRAAAFGRGDGRVLVLRGDEGVLGVDLLRAEIHAALAGIGLAAPRAGPFEAHLTLVRGWDATPETFIAPITWTVREFVLIHSYVGETRYEIAGRFPLG